MVRGEWDDFGLFRILNRISFVCKNHLVFVVVFKTSLEDIGNTKRRDRYKASPHISSLDPEFFDLTFKHLHNVGLTARHIKYANFAADHKIEIILDEHKACNYAIQVWGSSIFVIVMELRVEEGNVGEKPNLELSLVEVSSALGGFISETLKPFDGKEDTSELYPELFSSRMFISKESADEGLSKLRQAFSYKRATNDDPKLLTAVQRELINTTFRTVCELVDNEYDRLKLSPLLNARKSTQLDNRYTPTTNVLFISKLFNSENMRYTHYKYNSQAVIPDNQCKDIIESLKQAKRSDYIPYDNSDVDNQFWEYARSKKGRQIILDVVRRPTPSSVRLFAESVLMSGTTLIKPRIFKRGAIGWVTDNLSPSDRLDALEHIGYLHFIMQLGSPIRPVDAKDLSLVALPFRCSGGIWMCATYVRENTSGPIDGLIDQKNFEESSLIYHSLFRETERRLRRRAKGSYTDALGKLIAQATAETRRRHGDDAILCLDAAACDSFEKNMRLLTRVYPFDGLRTLAEFGKNKFLPFDKIGFTSEDNGYFDRLTLHDFLGDQDSEVRLRERVLLANAMPKSNEDDETDE